MKRLIVLISAGFVASSMAIVPNSPIATYPGIGRMVDVSGSTISTFGTGFAISPNYILTASHVGGSKFEQNGVIFPILQTIGHPTADIALKRVGTPLFHALPIKTNYFLTGVPTGQTLLAGDALFLQGYGWTSNWSPTGFPFLGNNEGTLRQARNRLDLFLPQVAVDIGGGNIKTTDYLIYDLDDPMGQSAVNTLGGPAIGSDEGGMYTFDSGSPWTIIENSRPRAVAVGGIIGTFSGSGVTRPLNWGGFGGGANIQTYASWIQANVPDFGRSIMQPPSFVVGIPIGGSSANLYESDNLVLSTETDTTAADTENGLEMYFRGNTTSSPAGSLTLQFEAKSNSAVATVQVALRNVATQQYVTVASFLIFGADTTTSIPIPSPNTYIAASGDIDMRIASTATGDEQAFFRSYWDVIRMTATPN